MVTFQAFVDSRSFSVNWQRFHAGVVFDSTAAVDVVFGVTRNPVRVSNRLRFAESFRNGGVFRNFFGSDSQILFEIRFAFPNDFGLDCGCVVGYFKMGTDAGEVSHPVSRECFLVKFLDKLACVFLVVYAAVNGTGIPFERRYCFWCAC